ncbi:MAG TPA: hypothetical protein VIY69_00515 [Candidatus Acidoferrales bacterium]
MHNIPHTDGRKEHPLIATALNTLAIIACVYGLGFFRSPHHFSLAIPAIIFPLTVAIWLHSEGSYEAFSQLLLAFLAPSVFLALRALVDFQLVSFTLIWSIALICGLAVTLTMLQKYKRVPEPKFITANPAPDKNQVFIALAFVCTALYFYGAVAEANAVFDRSAAQTYEATVLGKAFSGGRGGQYSLELAPWGPQERATSVSVTQGIYHSAQVGQSVCVELHSGALKVPWYVLYSCH